MIIVAIKGGLGNQLFQYAFAKYLKAEFNSDVYIDTSDYLLIEKNKTIRTFLLSHLNNSIKYAPLNICSQFITKNDNCLLKLTKKIKRYCKQYFYFDENTIDLSKINNYKVIYIDGYWQDIKYLPYVLKELTDTSALVLNNNKIYKNIIKSKQSCAIHIRRGDYIENTFTNSIHGNCSFDFYLNAISTLEQKVIIENYFIFTDDLMWAEEQFKNRNNIYFVKGDLNNSITDLFLMKSCNHQIISNSSFSCWASYLNLNPDKITIAPKNWTTQLKTIELKLYNEAWILL